VDKIKSCYDDNLEPKYWCFEKKSQKAQTDLFDGELLVEARPEVESMGTAQRQ